MRSYKSQTIQEYLGHLSSKEPVPGGGSAASLVAALGLGLIGMAARYAKGRKNSKAVDQKIKNILKRSEAMRRRLLQLVDLDAKVYLNVRKISNSKTTLKKKALKKAQDVPREVCRLCYEAVGMTPFLVKHGSPYLVSDIQVAVEFLLAAFRASLIHIEVNQ
ncbi:MAG: cyclodeaminase/cyclohydrolase family protein [Candidatus Omnitrophota bacterium]